MQVSPLSDMFYVLKYLLLHPSILNNWIKVAEPGFSLEDSRAVLRVCDILDAAVRAAVDRQNISSQSLSELRALVQRP